MRFALEIQVKLAELIVDVEHAKDETAADINYRLATDPSWRIMQHEDAELENAEYLDCLADIDGFERLILYLRWYQDPTRHKRPESEGV